MSGKVVDGSSNHGKDDEVETDIMQKLPYHQLSCPHGDLLTFWKRCKLEDMEHVSPFEAAGPPNKYVTFEPGF